MSKTRMITVLGLLAGCEAVDVEDAVEPRVEHDKHGTYYEVAFEQVGAMGELERATGAVLVESLDNNHNQLQVGNDMIRSTCGVTFVTSRHAITAAHCVSGDDVWDPANQILTVEMYKVDPDLDWWNYTDLNGNWPNFSSPLSSLGPADGYEVEAFDCELVVRCGGNDWGPEINCNKPTVDIALLECDGNPGDQYGYVDVASSDAWGDMVFMPWKHEIYDADPTDADHFDHYIDLLGKTENYHYFEEGQLLPLRSKGQWHGDLWIEPQVLNHDGSGPWTWTNLFGCHGTSGSGISKWESYGAYTLLGPVARGSQMAGMLCHPDDVDILQAGMSYTDRVHTAEIAKNARCGEYDGSLLLWLNCHRIRLPIWVKFPDFGLDWPIFDGPPIERWRVRNEPLVEYAIGEGKLELPFGRLPEGMSARVSVHAVAMEGELDAPVQLLVDGEVVARLELGRGTRSGKLTAEFDVRDASAIVSVMYEGRMPLGLTELTLDTDGQVNELETMVERAGLGLEDERGALAPMRFVSDQDGGFAALLRRGETMALTRQSFVQGATGWSLRMHVDGEAEGLTLLAYGAGEGEVVRPEVLDIRDGVVTAVFYGIDLPVAITATAGEGDVMVHDISLASL